MLIMCGGSLRCGEIVIGMHGWGRDDKRNCQGNWWKEKCKARGRREGERKQETGETEVSLRWFQEKETWDSGITCYATDKSRQSQGEKKEMGREEKWAGARRGTMMVRRRKKTKRTHVKIVYDQTKMQTWVQSGHFMRQTSYKKKTALRKKRPLKEWQSERRQRQSQWHGEQVNRLMISL